MTRRETKFDKMNYDEKKELIKNCNSIELHDSHFCLNCDAFKFCFNKSKIMIVTNPNFKI